LSTYIYLKNVENAWLRLSIVRLKGLWEKCFEILREMKLFCCFVIPFVHFIAVCNIVCISFFCAVSWCHHTVLYCNIFCPLVCRSSPCSYYWSLFLCHGSPCLSVCVNLFWFWLHCLDVSTTMRIYTNIQLWRHDVACRLQKVRFRHGIVLCCKKCNS